MRRRLIVAYSIGFVILSGRVFAGAPSVENVVMSQRVDGSAIVDIGYDLIDSDNDTCAISLQISADGGSTWTFPVLSVGGDHGQGIVPGAGKNIEWHAGDSTGGVLGEMFRARVLASDLGTLFAVHSPRHVAITDFSAVSWSDPATIEKFSRADLVLVMAHHLWLGGNSATIDVIGQLKALNPEIKVLGYVSAKSAHMSGPNEHPDSYWYKWWERTEPYFMLTTAGAIAQDWPNSRLINILNPDCRRVQIETIIEMQSVSLNKFDGVYWDYFNNSIWVPPFMNIPGDPDLDGDSIGHPNDPDEMQAYRDAEESLVHALRDSLGDDFIQFFNGQRAYGDPAFAALGDGAMYELFPTLFFPDPDMGSALDPNYQYSLWNVSAHFRSQNGGPYLVLANPWQNRYIDHNEEIADLILGDMFRAVALVTDSYSSWNVETFTYGWSEQDVSLGTPLGAPTIEGSFIRRDFQYGKIEIEMTSGMYPDPFDYRIHILGDLFEEVAVPFHYP